MTHNILPTCLFFLFCLGSCSTFHSEVSRDIIESSPLTLVSPSLDNSVPAETLKDPSQELKKSLSQSQRKPSGDGLVNGVSFDWPVDEARMTRGFLPHKRRPHLGIDLAAPRGTPIFSSHQGLVIYTGREFRGFGKMILVESGHGWATLYAHLDKILVAEGQRVTMGDVIGTMGRTGRATGYHLHFEMRKDRGPVDPIPYLPSGRELARM